MLRQIWITSTVSCPRLPRQSARKVRARSAPLCAEHTRSSRQLPPSLENTVRTSLTWPTFQYHGTRQQPQHTSMPAKSRSSQVARTKVLGGERPPRCSARHVQHQCTAQDLHGHHKEHVKHLTSDRQHATSTSPTQKTQQVKLYGP